MPLPPPLQEHQRAVREALRACVEPHAAGTDPARALYHMMAYQLGWPVPAPAGGDAGGTRASRHAAAEARPRRDFLHGALCMEAAEAFGSDPRATHTGGTPAAAMAAAAQAAAAIELFVESCAVHEQMTLAEPAADGADPVWAIWGPAQAINAGDGLHALARLAVFALQGGDGLSAPHALAAVGILDAAALRYYEGDFLDLIFQERVDVTVAQYLRMAEAKSGGPFAAAVALGALVAGASATQVEALRGFGERLGLAVHIAKDIALLWPDPHPAQGPQQTGGARTSGRLLSKSKLLPVVYALDTGNVRQKRALGDVYFKRVMAPEDAARVRAVLDELDARAYAQARVEATARQALDVLGGAGLTAHAEHRWAGIVHALVGAPGADPPAEGLP